MPRTERMVLSKTRLGYAIRAIRSRTFAATVRSVPMGVGTNPGRIGGLAVALGIGAAIVAGHGVAWADPSGESGSESSSTSSTSTDSSTSTVPRTGAKPASTRPANRGSSDVVPVERIVVGDVIGADAARKGEGGGAIRGFSGRNTPGARGFQRRQR